MLGYLPEDLVGLGQDRCHDGDEIGRYLERLLDGVHLAANQGLETVDQRWAPDRGVFVPVGKGADATRCSPAGDAGRRTSDVRLEVEVDEVPTVALELTAYLGLAPRLGLMQHQIRRNRQ